MHPSSPSSQILEDVCDTVATTLGVPRSSVTPESTWDALGADARTILRLLVTLEAQFDLRFEDEAAAAAARTPGRCADLLAGRIAAADARARAGPLAGADDVAALAAKSSFFQYSSEMAAARGEPLPPSGLNTGRGWEVEEDGE